MPVRPTFDGEWYYVTPDQRIVDLVPPDTPRDPETGRPAAYSEGDPLLDGAYWAAETLLDLIYPVIVLPGDLGEPVSPVGPPT